MAVFKTIRRGYTGPEAELLQLALLRAGFLLTPPDGIFGRETEAALIRFQQMNGLTPDGIAGPKTWAALTPRLTGYFTHRVRAGDTLFRLARSYYTSLRAIELANPGIDPLQLRIGSSVIIPLPYPVVPENVSFTPTLLELVIDGLLKRYPFLRSSVIGQSVMGRDLTVLSIGSGQNEVFYNAAHHANEWITSPLLLRFIEEYAKAYADGGSIFGLRAGELFAKTTLYALPMVNPDGVALVTGELTCGEYYEGAQRISSDYPNIPFPSGWKANILGVDPNLQYPAGWENARRIKFQQGYVSPAPRDYVGRAPLEAPESRAVYDFTVNHDFSLTISYHTQGGEIYWRYLDMEPPGAEETAREFASVSGYTVSDAVYGSGYAGYKDWFIDRYFRRGYTIEAGRGQNPLPISMFNEIYRDNLGIFALGLT